MYHVVQTYRRGCRQRTLCAHPVEQGWEAWKFRKKIALGFGAVLLGQRCFRLVEHVETRVSIV